MNCAPIVLFAYNRPDHTRRTVEALVANQCAESSHLFVYSDGPKSLDPGESVSAVRKYLRSITGFKSVTVVERHENWGLANSVIAGVTEVLEHFPSVIVIEDDVVTSPNFLAFMNAALSTYEPRRDIFSVTGYNYPIRMPRTYREDAYLSYRSTSQAWGTWQDRWIQVDWSVSDYAEFVKDPRAQALFRRGGDDLPGMLAAQMAGQLDSWSIRFDYAHYKHNVFCVHPVISKVQNIGFDGTGVNSGISDEYVVDLDPGDKPFHLRPDLAVDSSVLAAFDRKFRPSQQPAYRRGLRRGNRLLRRVLSSAIRRIQTA